MLIRDNKIIYYIKGYIRQLLPVSLHRHYLEKRLSALKKFDLDILTDRVNYYNKLDAFTPLANDAISLLELKKYKKPKTYFIDAYEYARYFNKDYKAHYLFGDITYIDKVPTIQKSRPVTGNNANAVLLKLNKIRHYVFVKDSKKFTDKKDMLIGRSNVKQEQRIRFMNTYFGHPMCNLGQINTDHGDLKWLRPKVSRLAHLDYKFILCLEGYDVATNLKWVMSSNSLAVMPQPKYETWFMEGRLIPNHHYVEIREDFSDLEEKMNYYIQNPGEAQKIIENANHYIQQFHNKQQEEMIALLVMQKYFYYTGQADSYILLKK